MKRSAVFFVVAIFMFLSCGCATARKKESMDAQDLKNQIAVLEAEVKSKDDEIESLRSAMSAGEVTKVRKASAKKVIGELKSRPKVRQIQIALSNAGYNPGPIDGKMGRLTRNAVKEFQGANGLAADGKVGRRTWALLKEYLNKKIK